jgi:hypothetical protein
LLFGESSADGFTLSASQSQDFSDLFVVIVVVYDVDDDDDS